MKWKYLHETIAVLETWDTELLKEAVTERMTDQLIDRIRDMNKYQLIVALIRTMTEHEVKEFALDKDDDEGYRYL